MSGALILWVWAGGYVTAVAVAMFFVGREGKSEDETVKSLGGAMILMVLWPATVPAIIALYAGSSFRKDRRS